ncbi:MAG: MFS transporter [Victivallales bacterium]|nr:MFS transporter [Victivallales bacterium]
MTSDSIKNKNPLGFGAFLATLFLGAFNDNLSKMLVICYGTERLGASSMQGSSFLSLAAACFILPYLLFSFLAGYLADRFAKKTVMVWTKVAEIAIMLVGMELARRQMVYPLLAVLFFMGAQSAFFSPAKYGFLPETTPTEGLSRANGYTQLATFLAIILGGLFGGLLYSWCHGILYRGFIVCVAVAVLGTLTSFFITATRPGDSQLRFRFQDPVSPHWRALREMSSDRLLITVVLGATFFWFLGSLMQLVLVLLAQTTLGGGGNLTGILQAAVALGIGLGCTLAGLLAKGRIPYHLVAPGAVGIAVANLLLATFGNHLVPAILLTSLVGFAAGFYQLPLGTAIQERSPLEKRGRYLGATNALDCVSMTLSSALLWLLQNVFRCGPRTIIAVTACLVAVITPFLARRLPRQ